MPEPSESYGAFAYAYDQALGGTFFLAARRMLDDAMAKYPSSMKTHLDIACGTGYAVQYFEQHGFRSIGCDASLPMLGVARKRASRLVAADFRALPFRRTFARITCLYDSLNHLQTREGLTAAFRAVRSVMAPESLFFFDMNHPEIYPEVWGLQEPFVSTGKDHHLEIATKYRAREKRATGRVTGWAILPDGKRVSIRETHEQRAWSEHEIAECLREGGLSIVERIDFDPFGDIDIIEAAGVKLFYVVRAAKS